jgi:hypothetical protein
MAENLCAPNHSTIVPPCWQLFQRHTEVIKRTGFCSEMLFIYLFIYLFISKTSAVIYSVLLRISEITTPNVAVLPVPIVLLANKINISQPEQVMFAFNNTYAVHSCKKEKIQTSKVNTSEKFILR